MSEELVRPLADRLVAAGGGSVRAVVLYGSHLLRAEPDRHSAVDFVVIVDRYARFYRSLRRAGELPRPPWVMAVLAHLLPPNVIAFAPGAREGDREAGIAKCLVLTREHFERALGPRALDHFLVGRMVQKVALVWSFDRAEAERVESSLRAARTHVLDWMRPYLEGPFDVDTLGRRLLEVCYQGEVRPEAGDRAHRIYEAQAEHFRAVLPDAIRRGLEAQWIEQEAASADRGARYRLARPVPGRVRRRWRRHFRRSKFRATARWLKHTVTFSNWLPYVVRKVERHTGRTIELTPLERRLPLLFLWPRAIRILMNRPDRRPQG